MVSLILINKIETEIKASYKVVLETILNSSNESLKLIYQQHERLVTYWANDDELIKEVQNLLTLNVNKSTLINSQEQKNIRKMLAPVITHASFRGFFIIDNNDMNLASTRDSNIAIKNLLSKDAPDFLDKIRTLGANVSLPIKSDVPIKDNKTNQYRKMATMFSAAPIKNQQGETIAILTFRLEPDDILSAVLAKGRVGVSGDTYALSLSGLLLSENRFNKILYNLGVIASPNHSDLNVEIRDPGINLSNGKLSSSRKEQPLSEMAKSIARKESGSNMDSYRNYRGIPVIGAWLWSDQLGYALTAEIDVEEAYRDMKVTRLLIIFFTLLTIILIISISFVFSKNKKEIKIRGQYINEIFDNTAEGIVIIEENGTISLVNQAICNIFGYQSGELIGKNVDKLIPENLRNFHHHYMKEEENSAHVLNIARDIQALHKTGDLIPIAINISSMVVDNKKTFVCIIRDVSKRKEQEKELSQAMEDTNIANKAKSIFLSQMSHELRTPLNAILGFTQLLKMNKEELNENQNTYVNEIHMAGEHLLNLISEILDLSKIESGRLSLTMENVSIDKILKQCIQLIQPQLKEDGIDLIDKITNKGYFVNADPLRLKQVFLNILSNAIKYNRKHGTIILDAVEVEKKYLRLRISDTGNGLTKEELSHLFTPFKRLNHNNHIEGTGIGLVITKRLIELMGGNIGVESKVKKGSVVWFELERCI
ncbi:MAG: PAS domain-containing sensor histidine kinase [Gammaproteobacteria bacterium]|nr:PAS domain-containing sensor histidine kinase [Gammaproteobacteria bacterium]